MENIKNLKGKIYFTCSACMSVLADALSISWNPLWNGKWNRQDAEKRFLYYSELFDKKNI